LQNLLQSLPQNLGTTPKERLNLILNREVKKLPMSLQMYLTAVYPQLQTLTDEQVLGFCQHMKGLCCYVESGRIENDKSDDLPDRT